MPTAAREYIVASTLGNLSRCDEIRHALAAEFRRRQADGRCEGYFIRTLLGSECVLDELLELDEVAALTGGVFPAVWCNYTFNPAAVSDVDLAELERTFELRLYATAYSEYPKRSEPAAAPEAT